MSKKNRRGSVAPFKYNGAEYARTLIEPGPQLKSGRLFVPDIVEFLKQGEFGVNGEVMRQRARQLNANLGQHHAEYLLQHQELIPKEWRGKYYLVFPGTVWRDSHGLRHVPHLRWYEGRWYMSWQWLENDWGGRDRLVGLRK